MFVLITRQVKSLEEGYKYFKEVNQLLWCFVSYQRQLRHNQEYIKIKGPQLTGSALLKG